MTDLKTLKDFDYGEPSDDEVGTVGAYDSCKEDLRAEAIKRAKDHAKRAMKGNTYQCAYFEGKVDELVDFFNLTSKDLQ